MPLGIVSSGRFLEFDQVRLAPFQTFHNEWIVANLNLPRFSFIIEVKEKLQNAAVFLLLNVI